MSKLYRYARGCVPLPYTAKNETKLFLERMTQLFYGLCDLWSVSYEMQSCVLHEIILCQSTSVNSLFFFSHHSLRDPDCSVTVAAFDMTNVSSRQGDPSGKHSDSCTPSVQRQNCCPCDKGSNAPYSSSVSSSKSLCPTCIKAFLAETRQRRTSVLAEHDRLRRACHESLEASPPWAELQHELMDLHKKSEKLRTIVNQMALQTARMACANDERKASLAMKSEQVTPQRDILRRFETVLLEQHNGALAIGISENLSKVRRVRFQWAIAAFQMHRLDVTDVQQMTSRMKHARGIGKIGGLPLPHAGPELYSFLPPAELQSALRLVASLTSLVASCLGILLPHPILLTPHGSVGDLASQWEALSSEKDAHPFRKRGNTLSNEKSTTSQTRVNESTSSLSSSTASLASLVGQTARMVLAGTGGASRKSTQINSGYSAPKHPNPLVPRSDTPSIPPSLESSIVKGRIHHAISAVLAEASGSKQYYSLSVSAMQQPDGEEFTIALQLLQNNIVALCIRAGAPVAKLWPAEAVLLNLLVLQDFCQQQALEVKESVNTN